jgi:hypothetical protein
MDPENVDDLLEMGLIEVDEEEFETHLSNFSKPQQINLTGPDRIDKEGVVLCGRLVDVVHGEDAGKPQTLAIFEWYVHANHPGKRFKFAQIGVSFKSSTGDRRYDPAVVDCFPWGAYSVSKTTKKLETTRGWHPSVKLGQDGIATAENAFVYDLKETVERDQHIYVNGSPVLADGYTDPDRLNAVQWNLFESESQRSGVPRYFRTAVLLERKPGDKSCFTARIDMKVKVSFMQDAKQKIKTFLGWNVKDDPAIFDPTLSPTTHRFDDKLKSLRSVSLEHECPFLLFRKFPDATDGKQGDQHGKSGAQQGGGDPNDKSGQDREVQVQDNY